MDGPVGQTTFGELLPLLIILVINLIFAAVCIRIIFCSIKNTRKQRIKERQLKKQGVSVHTFFKHTHGLPIAENAMCEVLSYPERFDFKSDSMQCHLSKKKLKDISIINNADIQKEYVSSAGGAIAGGLLFGTLGAMIGGRTKSKETRSVSSCLILTYLSDSEIKHICFDVTPRMSDAEKLVQEYNKYNTDNSNIDL